MSIEEITLTTQPTVVVAGDYLKAGASITLRMDKDSDFEAVVKQAVEKLDVLYKHALLCEARNITAIQKRDSRKALISFLRKATSDGEEKSSSENQGEEGSRPRSRRVRRRKHS